MDRSDAKKIPIIAMTANAFVEDRIKSKEAGIYLVIANDGHQVFVMGHPEYDRYTLQKEYLRDKEKGLPIEPPLNYYPDDDTKEPLLTWRSHANILYSNWLNYYVYQTTPYEFIQTTK
jgi:homoserine O-succinyltransferase